MRRGWLLVFGMVVCALAVMLSGCTQECVHTDVVRIQVVGNSDTDADQAVKLQVKQAVVNTFSARWEELPDAQGCFRAAQDSTEEVEALANYVLSECGVEYTARAEAGVFSFPEKTYEDVIYPAGVYQAVKVILGEGQGQNWWCMIYPPLCLTEPGQEEEDPYTYSWLMRKLFGVEWGWETKYSEWKMERKS